MKLPERRPGPLVPGSSSQFSLSFPGNPPTPVPMSKQLWYNAQHKRHRNPDLSGGTTEMKNFKRTDHMFSLCGLNCALCSMKIGKLCPGCGAGDGNQGCPIARCSIQKEHIEYCFQCSEYPCGRYSGITEFDSFITHRHQLSDIERFQEIGSEEYHKELKEKAAILDFLLSCFNDGRRKTFFCLAVNLLGLADLNSALEKIRNEVTDDTPLKEKAAVAEKHLEEAAAQRGIELKLRKKKAQS